MNAILPIAITIFLAELGDKTQLATVLFASGREHSPWVVFLAAAGALVLSSAVAVAMGTLAHRFLPMIPLKLIAGLGFIAIGIWTTWEYVAGRGA